MRPTTRREALRLGVLGGLGPGEQPSMDRNDLVALTGPSIM